MADKLQPIPDNELERIINLSTLDLDFSNLEDQFRDLTDLAAKVSGTEISLINIIDSFTQWTIANHGMEIHQMPREESVCQYTIMSDRPLEIEDFRVDERFSTMHFVQGPAGLQYYYGLPLQISKDLNIGALCVLDTEARTMSPEKVELLEIIAQTVVKRLKSIHTLELLKAKLQESDASRKKAAHDIRGPLAGIIGLSELASTQDAAGNAAELMDYIGMINKSGRSLLELAEEILTEGIQKPLSDNEFNLPLFQDKLNRLYQPQAKHKKVDLEINVEDGHEAVSFAKNKLLQIAGNLVSNALKFTPEGGRIVVNLKLILDENENLLKISVEDNGVGIDAVAIKQILRGKAETTTGTKGEKGYGFGLSLVSHLVESLNGEITVSSNPGQGTRFEVVLPVTI